MAKVASLTAGLVAKKGEAVPVKITGAATRASEPASAAPEVPQSPAKVVGAGKDYFKALTVKLDKDRYLRLKQFGLSRDKTSQELFVEALDAYLTKEAQH
jgi:hypothetical protein